MSESGYILGVESSCDETSLALVAPDRTVRHQLIASQIAEHRPFGGVVPELASRGHLRRILPLLDQLFDEAGAGWGDVRALAVTAGPGLVGSLLVGVETAKSLAWLHGLPLVPVNHLHGHVASIFLRDAETRAPSPGAESRPLLSLIVSGGHTSLVLQQERGGPIRTLGQTIDDAVGEAFDKVAKFLALGYPGGPIIDRLCQGAPDDAHPFPRPLMDREGFDFSYSGLKTAVITAAKGLHKHPHELGEETKRSLCAAFQRAAIDCLIIRLEEAIREFRPSLVGVVGGVACNSVLRARVEELSARTQVRIATPRPVYCTDNAAMIAAAAIERLEDDPELLERGRSPQALRLNADANLALT